MVDFIVIGLPRSGTTWLANWLTTDTTLCLHDPFAHLYPDQLDSYQTSKKLGISCTGAYMMKWLAKQTCPVLIIERDVAEVDAELERMGLWTSKQIPNMVPAFQHAQGRRYKFEDIWNEEKAREMWSFLLPGIPFDQERYQSLSVMQIQPHMKTWKPSAEIFNDLINSGELCLG